MNQDGNVPGDWRVAGGRRGPWFPLRSDGGRRRHISQPGPDHTSLGGTSENCCRGCGIYSAQLHFRFGRIYSEGRHLPGPHRLLVRCRRFRRIYRLDTGGNKIQQSGLTDIARSHARHGRHETGFNLSTDYEVRNKKQGNYSGHCFVRRLHRFRRLKKVRILVLKSASI